MSKSVESRDVVLRKTPRTPEDARNGLDASKSREWWCWQCGSRVTVSAESEAEYGHGSGCPRGTPRVVNRGTGVEIWSVERVKEELDE